MLERFPERRQVTFAPPVEALPWHYNAAGRLETTRLQSSTTARHDGQ